MHIFFRYSSVASCVGSASRCFFSVFFVFFDLRVRFVSPMYVALQFLHVMVYTPSHIFCGSTFSCDLTSGGVVRLHCCVPIVFLHDP